MDLRDYDVRAVRRSIGYVPQEPILFSDTVENNIAGVTYSSIAQGILTGKFGLKPEFKEGDQRGREYPV